MQKLYLLAGSAAMVFAMLTSSAVAQAEDASQLRMPPMTYLGAGQSAQPPFVWQRQRAPRWTPGWSLVCGALY